jgi:DNA repair exonuclease SbcCD ATPase subunit
MHIEFIKLDFKNVLSYGNNITTFDFKDGIDLINAKNGAGKSSFIDALTFALYGVPFRKIKKGSLVNHYNNKELLTSIIFKIEGSGYFKVVRGIKPNVFEIYHNKDKAEFAEKQLLPQSATVAEYQNMLESDVLKMNENVYRQLIVLGANISTSKNFMDLNAKEKEDVFNIITDTSVFNDLKQLVKKKVQVINTYIMEHEYKVNLLNNTLNTEQKNIDSLKSQNEIIINDKQKIIAELEAELSAKRSKVPEYENAIEKLKELKELYNNEKIHSVELHDKLNSLYTTQRLASDELHHIERAKDGIIVCDNCDNNINLTEVDISDDRHSEIKQKLDIILSDINDISATSNEIKESLNKKYEKLLNSKRILQNQKENLNRIDSLIADIESKKEWKELEIDMTSIAKIKKDLDEEKKRILELKDECNNLNVLLSLVGEDELKGFMLSQQIPVLNRYINQFIERFNAFEYNFVIDTNFKEKIISRNEEKEFNAMSNGQKQRITFSILFAFLKLVEEKNGVSTNLLILDEVLDSSSDAEGKLELIKILTDDFSKTKNVIIISHSPDIVQNVEQFNRIIRIEHDIYSKMIME